MRAIAITVREASCVIPSLSGDTNHEPQKAEGG
jgi:hypothetical protein